MHLFSFSKLKNLLYEKIIFAKLHKVTFESSALTCISYYYIQNVAGKHITLIIATHTNMIPTGMLHESLWKWKTRHLWRFDFAFTLKGQCWNSSRQIKNKLVLALINGSKYPFNAIKSHATFYLFRKLCYKVTMVAV